MKKQFLLMAVSVAAAYAGAQTVTYDFAQDPSASGWTFDNSGTGSGMLYASGSQEIVYDISTGADHHFLHRSLPFVLKDQFCAQFRIRPGSDNNYNTFFPLLLAPYALTGNASHPWRLEPENWFAGDLQDLDLMGVEVLHNQVRFVARDGNNGLTTAIIQPFADPFYMLENTDYWIVLERIHSAEARLSVYADAALGDELRSQVFGIPDIEPLNEIYLSNGNGNSSTSQTGTLDDYRISDCRSASVSEEDAANVEVYPNPATGMLTIVWPKNMLASSIAVLTADGHTVIEVQVQKDVSSVSVDVTGLAPGIYFVRGNSAALERFVKQ